MIDRLRSLLRWRPTEVEGIRFGLLIVGVAVGGVMIGLMMRLGHVVNDQHDRLLHGVDEPVTLTVESERGAFDGASLSDLARALPELSLHPILETVGVLAGHEAETLRVIGVDLIGDRRLPLPGAFLGDRSLSEWREPVALVPPTLVADLGLVPGDTVLIRGADGSLEARLSDAALPPLFHAGTDQRIVAVDVGWFEERFGSTGGIAHRVALSRDGAPPLASLERLLDERLPEGAYVVRRGERTETARAWVGAWRIAASLISQAGVFVGVVFIFLSAHLAYLRRGRGRSVASWKGFLGDVGEVFGGVAGGVTVAVVAEKLLAAGWIWGWRRATDGVSFPISEGSFSGALVLLAVAAFVVASMVAALRVQFGLRHVRPRAGLRFGVAGALLVTASMLTVPPTMDGSLPRIFASAFLVVLAIAMSLHPALDGVLATLRPIIGRRFPLVPRVVSTHLRDGWPQVSVAVSLLVFAFGVFGVGWTVVDEMAARQRSWLAGEAAPDVLLKGQLDESGVRSTLTSEWVETLNALPAVESVTASLRLPATLRHATFPMVLLVEDALAHRAGIAFEGSSAPTERIPVWVTKRGARDFALGVGDQIHLTTDSGIWPAAVAAVVPDRVGEEALAFASLDRHGSTLTNDSSVTEIGVRLMRGSDPEVGRRQIVAALPGARPLVVGTDRIREQVATSLEVTARGMRLLLAMLAVTALLMALTLGPTLAFDAPESMAVLAALGVPKVEISRAAAVAAAVVTGVGLALGLVTTSVTSGVLLLAIGTPDGFALPALPLSLVPALLCLVMWIASGLIGGQWARRAVVRLGPLGRAVASLLLLSGATSAAASEVELRFPEDHHAHAEASHEWWVLLAHVRDGDGGWHAVQASFQRLDFATTAGEEWATGALFPAMVGITDLTDRSFRLADRVDREGPGSVAFDPHPVALRHRAWVVARSDTSWTLDARVDTVDVSLTFRPRLDPIVMWSQAPSDSTPLTVRYVIPHLRVRGELSDREVSGVGWFDHAWGDPILSGEEAGWEFLATHLRDGAALVVYRTRTVSRQVDRRSGGVYLSATGSPLSLDELLPRFYPVGSVRWVSESTEISYPKAWRIEVPSLELDLTVEASPPHQELDLARTHGVSLWRGSVDVAGKRGSERVTGAGFLEIVGYGGRFPPILAERD